MKGGNFGSKPARLLTDRQFLEFAFERVLRTSAKLCFEITETAVIENRTVAMANIAELRMIGVKISIDDYGSGLSSVSYLKQIHADELKLDRSLVVALKSTERDRLVVKSTIELAHSLDMTAVGEGIEDRETMSVLENIGCDTIQGYLISKPFDLKALITMLGAEERPESLTA